MMKIFVCGKFEEEETFGGHEEIVIKSILFKKKFAHLENVFIDGQFLNELICEPQRKKKENNLKYVFPKCFKFLKRQLEKNILKNGVPDLENLRSNKVSNQDLIRFYFGAISQTQEIPIERFFIFRNWTHRFCQNVPKTVTTESIRLWKKNPRFIEHICDYLVTDYIGDVRSMNNKKIDLFVRKWLHVAYKKGLKATVREIKDSMKLKKTKLPWTLYEAKNAADVVLNLIYKVS